MGIIGAGFGGIAAAIKLRQRTSASVVIFEQSDEVGGTWYDNRYPGCEVDIPSHAYSFSFHRHDWPRTHARQPELLRYANEVVDAFGLRPLLRLGTKVTEVLWDENEQHHEVRTADGESHEFDVVISALGLLSVPNHPEWPGLEDFRGPAFHTSRWRDDVDLRGKRVAVVGTGSTAAQIVPGIAGTVGSLLVFQREPGWVEPKQEREFTARERWVYRHVPGAQRLHRGLLFGRSIARVKAYDTTSRMQETMRGRCTDYIRRTVHDPATREAVTPDYPWGCKRPVLASTFYEALNLPHVDLVPHPVTSVTGDGLVDDRGVHHDVDVLVLSTGFQPTRFLSGLDVRGIDKRSIHDAWKDRASAFLGVTVAGFPNFFVLYGPNTNGGFSIIAQLERQAEIASRAVRRLERGAGYVDTDERAQRRWVAWVDDQIARKASAMESGCRNYYHSPGGANVTQWPGSHLKYLVVTRLLDRWGIRAFAVPR
ncbi:flavin-containing monooxygenase [Pseudonocardia abyssalis]|uniref:NAD(P)/FAD-dependent oxidoreductase n=1 Tax=Pseudonocardia abyssalis TaxID=2792008 RepID=A0ABS6UND5_9PSEU|nr:NAD(P)/FAD-dependent oxidoreductase [Pseudonocardia abyssalis]MBW0115099.1 NAD(P)/FAD-dependent oxidoreductase [Pseudonocardia abyssalis]MBW0133761.1 NAD(P)/FAD-dependent oxidoreductase [Pseudonocardia abyssalis]